MESEIAQLLQVARYDEAQKLNEYISRDMEYYGLDGLEPEYAMVS
jgi:hypothetical protein